MSHGYRFVMVFLLVVLLLAPTAALAAPADHAASAPGAVSASQGTTYVVRSGDTLAKIAARYGVSIRTLMQVNRLANGNIIWTGQRLIIPGAGSSAATTAPAAATSSTAAAPAAGVYIVKRGDTLAIIASRYHTTVRALMVANGLTNANYIWTGQRLKVNGAASSAAAASPAPSRSTTSPAPVGGKWIDVNLSQQRLTAYEGQTPVLSTLISGGTAAHPTVVGRFAIRTKLASQTMSGPGYWLPNVPYVMYFYGGYAIHGTYWHHNFGHPMSHGCVNMTTSEAAWVYSWAPVGTPVVTHW